MRPLRDIPIKQKLMMIIMITTSVALLLAGIGIIASDALLFRRYLARDLSTLVRIIADNSTAALAFNDPEVATETLAALRARTHMVAACIYGLDGTVFASYARPNAPAGCPVGGKPAGGTDELKFSSRDITVSRAILLSGRPMGTLVLL
jgi:hypothetical protein